MWIGYRWNLIDLERLSIKGYRWNAIDVERLSMERPQPIGILIHVATFISRKIRLQLLLCSGVIIAAPQPKLRPSISVFYN